MLFLSIILPTIQRIDGVSLACPSHIAAIVLGRSGCKAWFPLGAEWVGTLQQ